jgi:2-polyprenyl-3-methyl-5-hydroxy-6-metoxy-1,4-benzoquinol methylase
LREAERTYQTYGIDISEHAISRAKKETSRSTLGVVDVESRRAVEEFVGGVRFDIIVAINVLEHLKSPHHVLEHAYELLVPGGHLFFKVPKADALIRHWYSFQGREHEWQALKDKTHVSLLPREEWMRSLDAIGFSYMELPTIPTGKMKRWFSNIDALHRFYFLPRLTFLSHINEGLTVLGWKGQS